MAAVQLRASWELAGFVGYTHRSFAELAFFGFPPAHWAELAIPGYLRGIPGGPEATYWYSLGTSGYEACFYVGTIPLILSFLGIVGGGNRQLAPWLFISAVCLALAMLPIAWPAAYAMVVQVPGFGWFRGPGRYVVLASFGLCLAAGRGLDRAAGGGPIRLGLGLASVFATAAASWVVYWSLRADNRPVLGGPRLATCLITAGVCWGIATVSILAWRSNRIGAWILLLVTAGELGWLYYTSTTDWGWSVDLPRQSRILASLASEEGMQHVAGLLHNLPVRAGVAPIFPYTGFAPPPPHPYLQLATRRAEAMTGIGLARLRRYGVTHGVWDGPVDQDGVVTLLEAEDPVLDRLVYKPPGAPPRALWRIVRYPEPFPESRAAIRVRVAPSEGSLISGISFDPDPQAVWYAAADQPPNQTEPRATSARIVSWDGQAAVVEHDGRCDLVINRTFYPGWFASINDAPEQPVIRAELGIQAVPLRGKGTTRVAFAYRPTGIKVASELSLGALAFAWVGLSIELVSLCTGWPRSKTSISKRRR
jgi:hypothetical protein